MTKMPQDLSTLDRNFDPMTATVVAFDLAEALVKMVGQRDPYTSGHMSRVAWLSVHIGKKLDLDPHRLDGLRLGAELHDLGKSSIPTEILIKPGRLSTQELELVREHPKKGHDIVSHFSWSWPIPDMLLQHHERIDGTGYPLGIRGQDMLEEAKIIAVADVVESIISHRPYRPALPSQRAMEELTQCRGTRYDSTVVDACMALLNHNDFNLPSDVPDFSQTADRS
jgi:HD-GYP domain-containing protein (c-di-GMP phosphodiesterase class II)